MPDEPQTTPVTSSGSSPQGGSYPGAGGTPPSATPSGTAGLPKEQEPLPAAEAPIEEMVGEVEVTPELTAFGVEKRGETIELPPDVKKMGVSAVGPMQPIPPTTSIKLPLTDDQIAVGLHAQIISSLRWLAEWCIRQLKRAHYHLKVIAGHAVREQDSQ